MKDRIFKENGFDSSPFGPPDSPGVYAVCISSTDFAKKDLVMYIGSSTCISKRVLNVNHIYRRLYSRLNNYYVVTKCLVCDDYLSLEKHLIRKYKPRFNRNGK